MIIKGSATVVSWVPSDCGGDVVLGADSPPGSPMVPVEAMDAQRAFRFLNRIEAWARFENYRVVDHGVVVSPLYSDRVAPQDILEPVMAPPVIRADSIDFTHTVGVRMADHAAWTTVRLTLAMTGLTEVTVPSASIFPRHWAYDMGGMLVLKSALLDWYSYKQQEIDAATPWTGAYPVTPFVEPETPLERKLSGLIMGSSPELRTIWEGEYIAKQGEEGDTVFLVLDGVVSIEVDGRFLYDVGPGTVLGERAAIEGGLRSASMKAATNVRIAEAKSSVIDTAQLRLLSMSRHREAWGLH